jgi:hypothetical protein
MREYRLGGNSGYPRFAGGELVIQTMRDIYGNLDETFADLSVPSGFVTPKLRSETFAIFLAMLKDRGTEFGEIETQLIEEGRAKDKTREWKDFDYLPEPFKQIDKIRRDVLAAVEHTLELEKELEVVAVRRSHDKLSEIFGGYHRFIVQLGRRHNCRSTLKVVDEYDVQDALHALLMVHFADVRAEEYTPSYAGGSSRVDFLLDDDEILIEVKMTRDGLKDKQIGDQIAIDMVRYKAHPKCKSVYFFIYDPAHILSNPGGLIRDLSRTVDGIRYHAVITPRL